MPSKLTVDAYRSLALDRHIVWLDGVLPQNTNTPTCWQCEAGHTFSTTYALIREKKGNGCIKCSGSERKTLKDYRDMAALRNAVYLSDSIPPNTAQKAEWECLNCKRRWWAKFATLRAGSACPNCAGHAAKTLEDYVSAGSKMRCIFDGETPPKLTRVKTYWRCMDCQHRWLTNFNTINDGHGCPRCGKRAMADKNRKTIAAYKEIALRNKVEWTASEPPLLTEQETTFRCEAGHEFSRSYRDMKRLGGCPDCIGYINSYRTSQIQIRLCEMVEGHLNTPFGSQRIDVLVERNGVSIAIEYDGYYWHFDRQQHDGERDLALINAGYRVLRIKSGNYLPSRTFLNESINRLLSGSTYEEIVLPDWIAYATKQE